MKNKIREDSQEKQATRGDSSLTWGLVAVGLVSALACAGYVFNENLYAYGLCWAGSRQGCGDGPWFTSMGLSFFGGIAVVAVGAVLGVRRRRNGRTGFWFPLGALGAVAALTGLSLVVLNITTPL